MHNIARERSPNKGMEPTAYSVRSYVASASGSGSCLALSGAQRMRSASGSFANESGRFGGVARVDPKPLLAAPPFRLDTSTRRRDSVSR